jgi:hypothetical protein
MIHVSSLSCGQVDARFEAWGGLAVVGLSEDASRGRGYGFCV